MRFTTYNSKVIQTDNIKLCLSTNRLVAYNNYERCNVSDCETGADTGVPLPLR